MKTNLCLFILLDASGRLKAPYAYFFSVTLSGPASRSLLMAFVRVDCNTPWSSDSFQHAGIVSFTILNTDHGKETLRLLLFIFLQMITVISLEERSVALHNTVCDCRISHIYCQTMDIELFVLPCRLALPLSIISLLRTLEFFLAASHRFPCKDPSRPCQACLSVSLPLWRIEEFCWTWVFQKVSLLVP